MTLSLHSALIPSMMQVLGSAAGFVDKAHAWCDEHGHSHQEIVGARLIDDMLPFSYQVKSCWTHSAHAVASAQTGLFTPEMSPPPDSFDGLRDKLAEATTMLSAVEEAELENLAGNDMRFQIGDRLRMDFTVQDFLLSFSQPNFYFHAATAYDILRMKGLALGKRDYLGALRLKT